MSNSKISKQKHIIEEVDDNGEIQYNCTSCRKLFRSRSQRYYHLKCNELQNLTFKCEYCDRSFARRTQWKYHTESHISPVNICDKCRKTFRNPLALKKHLTLHNVEPKLCPHCDKSFRKKISLDQHIAAQHLHQLQFGCVHCSKKYASKSSLQLHLQTHERKRFECKFCGKLFQRNSILNLHLQRHYSTNKYVCTVCQKVFKESGTLARHRKTHEESAIQYYCKFCNKSMLRKDNMARHLTTIHPEEKFEDIVKIIKSPKTLPSEQSIFETELNDLYNKPFHENIEESSKSFIIIENKLLHEPFAKKDSIVEHPLAKQINVITAAPNCKEDIFNKNNVNISQEFAKHYKTHHQHEDQETFYKNSLHKNLIEQIDINAENDLCVNHDETNFEKIPDEANSLIIAKPSGNISKYNLKTVDTAFANHHSSVEKGLTPNQAFSSVIRSIGNVNRNINSNVIMQTNQINQMSLGYKHKKYCRNNYNIDLYRKILGCDDDADDENSEKQEKCDHMQKPSTPVHWRKCFKNNYETTGT